MNGSTVTAQAKVHLAREVSSRKVSSRLVSDSLVAATSHDPSPATCQVGRKKLLPIHSVANSVLNSTSALSIQDCHQLI